MGKLPGNEHKHKEQDLSKEFAQRVAAHLGGSCVHIGRKVTKGKNLDMDAVE